MGGLRPPAKRRLHVRRLVLVERHGPWQGRAGHDTPLCSTPLHTHSIKLITTAPACPAHPSVWSVSACLQSNMQAKSLNSVCQCGHLHRALDPACRPAGRLRQTPDRVRYILSPPQTTMPMPMPMLAHGSCTWSKWVRERGWSDWGNACFARCCEVSRKLIPTSQWSTDFLDLVCCLIASTADAS